MEQNYATYEMISDGVINNYNYNDNHAIEEIYVTNKKLETLYDEVKKTQSNIYIQKHKNIKFENLIENYFNYNIKNTKNFYIEVGSNIKIYTYRNGSSYPLVINGEESSNKIDTKYTAIVYDEINNIKYHYVITNKDDFEKWLLTVGEFNFESFVDFKSNNKSKFNLYQKVYYISPNKMKNNVPDDVWKILTREQRIDYLINKCNQNVKVGYISGIKLKEHQGVITYTIVYDRLTDEEVDEKFIGLDRAEAINNTINNM